MPKPIINSLVKFANESRKRNNNDLKLYPEPTYTYSATQRYNQKKILDDKLRQSNVVLRAHMILNVSMYRKIN